MMTNKNIEQISNVAANRNVISEMLCRYLHDQNLNYTLIDGDGSSVFGNGNIGIVVPKNDFGFISKHISRFCQQANLILVQTLKYETTACLFVLSYYNKTGDRFIDIKVDFCSDFKVNSRLYLSSEELLYDPSYIIEKKSWQISNTSRFFYHFIKVVENLSISEEQFLQLAEWWGHIEVNPKEKLSRFFSDTNVSMIMSCFKKKDFKYLYNNVKNLQQDLHLMVHRNSADIIANRFRLIKNSVKPSGLVIGILGRDGCGKSTFVNEMAASLGTYFADTITFKKFPAIFYKGEIFKKKEEYHFSKPHYHEERGRFGSFLKLNLILLEFLLGYWIKIFPAKVKSKLVLYDRYFIDVLADPRRYRIKENKFFIKIYHRILPKPDLWIILDLPSEILLKRKQELTYEMAEKLRYEYLNLQSILPNSIVINNDEEINKTVNKASSFIFNYLHQKVAV
jgi:thymidylate kinase